MQTNDFRLLGDLANDLLDAQAVEKTFGRVPLWIPASAPHLPTEPNNCVLVAVQGWKRPSLGHYNQEDGKWYDVEYEYPFVKPVEWWMPLPKVPYLEDKG